MPAAAVTAGIGAVGSVISGLTGAHAARKAGEQLQKTADEVAGSITDATKAGQQQTTAAVQDAQGRMEGATAQAQEGMRNATTDAQQSVRTAADDANLRLGDVFKSQQDVLDPYLQAGYQGADMLMKATAPGGTLSTEFTAPTAEDVRNTPGYQFKQDEARKQLERSAATAGLLQSGGTAKALVDRSQNVADTYYQNAFQNALQAFQTNRQNTMQSLGLLLNTGQYGTGQFMNASQNFGNTTADNLMKSSQLAAGYGMAGAEYGGNAGMTGAQYEGNTGLQGAEFNANLGFSGAKAAGDAKMNGAQGNAAGIVGAGNAYQNMINGVVGAGSQIATTLMKPASSSPSTSTTQLSPVAMVTAAGGPGALLHP